MTNQSSWIYGKADECDVVVLEQTVSGRHCRLERRPDGYLLEDLGSTNGTFVNGHRIDGQVRVRPSDQITLGSKVPMEWPAEVEPERATASVRVIRIGKADDNDVILRESIVSQYHARIEIGPNGTFLVDLGSTNGTFVGSRDRRIDRSPISSSDRLYFGSIERPASHFLREPEVENPANRDSDAILRFIGSEMVVGRLPETDLTIDLPMISGRHARLSRGGTTIQVEDLGSANGTFVNGRKIDQPTTVSPGDLIALGSHTLTLVDAESPRTSRVKPTNGSTSKTVRVFVSSPGDVSVERGLAENVIQRVADRNRSILNLEPVIWEHEPLLATSTFQEQITKPADTDFFVCILWSRLGTPLKRSMVRADGTSYHSGTEYEFENAMESHQRRGKPDLIVYRKSSEPTFSLKDTSAASAALQQKLMLDGFVNKWFHSADGTLAAAFHPFDDASEFEKHFEMHLIKMVENRAKQEGWTAEQISQAAQITWDRGSPYRGLESFDFEHEPIFFGRTRAISSALEVLRFQAAEGHPFLVVVASSGSGKSSLVKAGLIPMLTRSGVIREVTSWRRATFRPSDIGGDLFLGLATALLQPTALPEIDRTYRIGALSSLLRDQPEQAVDLITRTLGASSQSSLVLVIDQMEELFSIEGVTEADRMAFCERIEQLCLRGIWVVATLRSDFYHRFVEIPPLTRLKAGRGQFDLRPPTASEIAAIIRQPAIAAGLLFEYSPKTQERLEDLLCDAATRNPESLPLLEFTLDELYQKRSDRNALTLKAYRALGGLEGALANRAQEVFEQLPGDVQAQLPRVFRRLVAVGEGTAVTRKPASKADLTADPLMARLVEAFVQARLVVTNQGTTGVPTIEISHEALLTRWEPLRQWIASDRELLVVRDRVASAARLWAENERSSDRLLADGQPLQEAKRLVKAGFDLSKDERALIARSTLRARINRQAKRVAVTSLSILSVVALGALVYALINGRRAENSFNTARATVDTFVSDIADEGLGDLPGLQETRKKFARLGLDQYNAFARDYPDKPEVQAGQANARASLGLIEGSIGSFDAAIENLKKAIAQQEAMVAKDPSTPQYRFQLAKSYYAIGFIDREAEHYEEGLGYFKAEIELLEGLIKNDLSHPEYRYERALAYKELGNCLPSEGKKEEIRRAFKESEMSFKQLSEELSKTDEALAAQPPEELRVELKRRKDLIVRSIVGRASALNNLGTSEAGQNALNWFELSLIESKRAKDAGGQSPEALRIEAVALRNRGNTLKELGRLDEAAGSYEKCVEKSRELARANPLVSRFRWSLADNLKSQADFLTLRQQHDRSKPLYEECCEILDQLTRQVDDRPLYGIALIQARINLANFLQWAPAVTAGRSTELTKGISNSAGIQLEGRKVVPEYIKALDIAVETGKRLVRKEGRFSNDRDLNYQYALALNKRASALADDGNGDDSAALPDFENCLAVLLDHVINPKARPTKYQLSQFLETSQFAVMSAERLGRHDVRARITKKAVEFGKDCKTTAGVASLADMMNKQAIFLATSGRDRDAIEIFRRSLALSTPELAKVPWHFYLRSNLGVAHLGIAKCSEKLGDLVSEAEAYRAWLQVIGHPILGMTLDEGQNSGQSSSRADALRLRDAYENKPGMKRFTVPIEFDGLKTPVQIYISDAPEGSDPFEDQVKYWKEERGGVVPNDVRESFRKLRKIAADINVPFQDLCVYALASNTKDDSIQLIWTLNRQVFNGNEVTGTPPFDRLVILGEYFTLYDGGKIIHRGIIRTEGNAMPKSFDWTWKERGQVTQSSGLLSVEGNRLTLCFDLDGKNRPTTLQSKPGSQHALLIFEQKK